MPTIKNNFWKLLFNGFRRSWRSLMVSFCVLLKSSTYLWRNWLLNFFIQALQKSKFYFILYMLESLRNLCEVHDLFFLLCNYIVCIVTFHSIKSIFFFLFVQSECRILLLSEHILCKENTVIVKKLNFEILMYLYVLRIHSLLRNSFMLFLGVMYVCVCAYVCMCMRVYMWMNMIVSKQCIRLTSSLVCVLQVSFGRILFIFVNIGWIVFFLECKKEFLYITAK